MISEENKEMSIEKWDRIVKQLEKRLNPNEKYYQDHIIYIGSCGFCDEIASISERFNCDRCPLYQDKFCSNDPDTNIVFWMFEEALGRSEYAEALELAKRLLERIKQEPVKEMEAKE